MTNATQNTRCLLLKGWENMLEIAQATTTHHRSTAQIKSEVSHLASVRVNLLKREDIEARFYFFVGGSPGGEEAYHYRPPDQMTISNRGYLLFNSDVPSSTIRSRARFRALAAIASMSACLPCIFKCSA